MNDTDIETFDVPQLVKLLARALDPTVPLDVVAAARERLLLLDARPSVVHPRGAHDDDVGGDSDGDGDGDTDFALIGGRWDDGAPWGTGAADDAADAPPQLDAGIRAGEPEPEPEPEPQPDLDLEPRQDAYPEQDDY